MDNIKYIFIGRKEDENDLLDYFPDKKNKVFEDEVNLILIPYPIHTLQQSNKEC